MVKKIQSVNPYNEEINWEFEVLSLEEIDKKLEIAYDAYLSWKNTPHNEKKELFLKLANVVENEIENLARMETIEMWRLYKDSLNWLKNTANLIRWFANNFENILKEEEYETEWVKVITQYDSIWVIFGIAPWNFPFNQVLRAAVPNILAWNTQIYKHASNVPLAWIEIEKLFLNAWFPVWVYQNIIVSSSDTEYIISKKEIAWVNLTWSEWAWRTIWALAWKYLKPSVLELGWNDAFIICDTKNLEQIAIEWVKARTSNNWQKCNSSKRFIVREKDYDEFLVHFKKHMESLSIWDPFDEKIDVWPLAKKDLVEEIDKQVQKTINEWARLITWWKKLNSRWYFYLPTILADVTNEMTSYKEEVFGPVASVIKVKDLDEAIRVANNSDFWLCWCVYWDNEEQLKAVASKIETWMVFINRPAWSKASLPFGWVKKSWYWKENWPEGLRAFTNRKVIVY
jgi:succinate-semialdehyde dehydrogenase / glutarate-semialdehyde dehydrogenase